MTKESNKWREGLPPSQDREKLRKQQRERQQQQQREQDEDAHKRRTVFISHSHKDKEVVRRIANDLQKVGVTVWLDEDVIGVGDPWAEKLSHAIAQKDAVLVVVSRNTATSRWQSSEIAFSFAAQKHDRPKQIIPILVDKNAEIPFFLKSLQYCDLSDGKAYKQNFPRLVEAIQRPQAEPLRMEELYRFYEHGIKAERFLLTEESEFQAKKKSMRMTAVLAALASTAAASASLIAVFGGNIKWGHSAVDFVMGAVGGVVASFLAFYVSYKFWRSSEQAKRKNAR